MKADSSKYRAVLDTFWADMDVLEWTPDEKLFYLWVLTNQHLDICGCYQVSTKVMAHETRCHPGADTGVDCQVLKAKTRSGIILRRGSF